MSMDNYLAMQVFTVVVAAVLLVTFYILAAGSMASGANLMTPLILIILSVICLAILSTLNKIAKKLKA
jgi:cytosine/uracil/thiamine/allantoin permease